MKLTDPYPAEIVCDDVMQHVCLVDASSTAQHSTAQHSTAQHGMARHGTARHGTARHRTASHVLSL